MCGIAEDGLQFPAAKESNINMGYCILFSPVLALQELITSVIFVQAQLIVCVELPLGLQTRLST
jgi:hypothetical protein